MTAEFAGEQAGEVFGEEDVEFAAYDFGGLGWEGREKRRGGGG